MPKIHHDKTSLINWQIVIVRRIVFLSSFTIHYLFVSVDSLCSVRTRRIWTVRRVDEVLTTTLLYFASAEPRRKVSSTIVRVLKCAVVLRTRKRHNVYITSYSFWAILMRIDRTSNQICTYETSTEAVQFLSQKRAFTTDGRVNVETSEVII